MGSCMSTRLKTARRKKLLATVTMGLLAFLIGTNDLLAPSGHSDMPNRLGSLIDKIISAAPDALLVVAKIIPIAGSANPVVGTYNDAIPGLVQSRAAAGKHILLADMNTGFDAPNMLNSDGVHPNETGYDFMGDQWYAVLGSLLPKQFTNPSVQRLCAGIVHVTAVEQANQDVGIECDVSHRRVPCNLRPHRRRETQCPSRGRAFPMTSCAACVAQLLSLLLE